MQAASAVLGGAIVGRFGIRGKSVRRSRHTTPMTASDLRYAGYRFPPEIIAATVFRWRCVGCPRLADFARAIT